jgi:penicillin-binding protein A
VVKRSIKKYVWHSTVFLFGCFCCLLIYIIYLQVIKADDLASNPLNQRTTAVEADILRGSILDAKGRKLAFSSQVGSRSYPMGASMAPVTGYIGEKIGNAGVESFANRQLLGLTENLSRLGPIAQLFVSDKGNDVKLTIDADVQQTAYKALENHRGAVVVLDAQTGAVLAMVSRPSYDPNDIEADWETLNKQTDSPLLNRASQGLYPPGSTLKVMIADAALKEQVTDLQEVFNCTGHLDLGGGYILQESHGAVHGKVNLEQALTESCNITFATLAMRMGATKLDNTFERYGFRKKLGNEIIESMPHLPEFSKLNQGDIAQVGIGQSELLVTPLRMAMLAAAFANHGVIMQPYLMDEVITPGGIIIEKNQQRQWLQVTSPEQAGLVDAFMEKVVLQGTGTAARISGIRVTGKTGTAENSGGDDHAWFIGSADVRGRKLAFAILMENSGGGGTEAAPIAKKIIVDLLEK